MGNLDSVRRVNFYLNKGIRIGIAYHWASFDLGRGVVSDWLKWKFSGQRQGPYVPFIDWRTSSLMPSGVDNSNYSQIL